MGIRVGTHIGHEYVSKRVGQRGVRVGREVGPLYVSGTVGGRRRRRAPQRGTVSGPKIAAWMFFGVFAIVMLVLGPVGWGVLVLLGLIIAVRQVQVRRKR